MNEMIEESIKAGQESKACSGHILGQGAYEHYVLKAGGKSLVTGHPLPGWLALPKPIMDAWTCAACWVAGRVIGGHDWSIRLSKGLLADQVTARNAVIKAIVESPVDLENDGDICVRIPKHIWEAAKSMI